MWNRRKVTEMGRQRHLLDVLIFFDKVKLRIVENLFKKRKNWNRLKWNGTFLEESTCQSCVASCNSIWKAYFRLHPKMFTLMLFLDSFPTGVSNVGRVCPFFFLSFLRSTFCLKLKENILTISV